MTEHYEVEPVVDEAEKPGWEGEAQFTPIKGFDYEIQEDLERIADDQEVIDLLKQLQAKLHEHYEPE